MLIKPFTAPVNAQGQAIVRIRHDLHGLVWKVYQIGFGLGILNNNPPQVAAHVNGIPLAGSAFMQQSVFASITGEPTYAMESFFVGPPYILLSSGDTITCAVLGATSGDSFTAGAYVEEASWAANLKMGQ
jgi:hypothetical protein